MLSAHDEYVDEEDFGDDDQEYDDFDEEDEGDILSIDDASLLEFLEDNIEMLLQAVAVDDTVVLSRIHTMHAATQMTDTDESKEIAAGLHRLITLAEADDGRRSLAIAASSSEPWTEFVLQFYEEPYPRPSDEELLCDTHRNPLHYAAMSDDDNSNVIELLASGLDRGTAMILEEDDDGNTPLLYAAHFANVRCMKEILGAVLDEYQDEAVLSLIQKTNAEDLNSLHFAVFSGSPEALQVLIDWLELCTKTRLENSEEGLTGEEVNQLVTKEVKRILRESCDGKHRNLVHAAASCRSIAVTELLLKYDLNLFSTDKDRMSIVHWAVRGPDLTDATYDYVQYMADLGLDLTSKDCKNRTALHFAAYYGHQKVCEHLVKEAQLSVMATDRQGWNALHYAASTGSPALPILLNIGDDANPALTKNRKRMTPLHVAACKAKSDVFQQMVEFTTAERLSCFYNAVDYRGRTYLFYCARNNLFHGAHLLLDQATTSNDIGLHSVDTTGKNVFHAAAMSGALEVAQLVMNRFGREELDGLLRGTDKKGRTVFHLAAACGQPEMIEWAFSEELGDLVGTADRDGNLPLHYAARFGEMGCFFDLLGEAELTESMEKIMSRNKDGQTVLHAAAAGDAIMLEYLLDLIGTVETEGGERHELLTSKDRHGMTPLMIAASNGNWNTVSTLLANRPEALHEKDAYGRTLLHLSAMADTGDLLRELSHQEVGDEKLSLTAAADDGTQPLHFAAHHGSIGALQWLLFDANEVAVEGEEENSGGVQVNAVDKDGRTALHHAAMRNHVECVKLLTAHPGVDLVAKDESGRTAIDAAAYAGNASVVDCLLEVAASREVDVSGSVLKDNDGRHPLHVACSQGHLEVCEVLLETHGVDANVADKKGRTALHRAAVVSPELVQLLVDHGADVNAQDEKGRSALMYCATCFDEDIMRLLLEDAQADPDLKDAKGRAFDHFLPQVSDEEDDFEEDEE